MEKAREVNPDRKPRVKPWQWCSVNTDNFPATHAVKPTPNIMHSIPLDLVSTAKSNWHIVCAAQSLHILSPRCDPGEVTPVPTPKD